MFTSKQSISFLAFLVFLISCQKETVVINTTVERPYNFQRSTKVSIQDIISFSDCCSYNGYTKSNTSNIISIDPILHEADTVMYLVNYKEDVWEVVSADIRAPRVLISGKTEGMSIDQLYSNPTQSYYMDELAKSLLKIASQPEDGIDEAFFTEDNWHDLIGVQQGTRDWSEWHLYRTEFLESYVVYEHGHLVTTKWGQDSVWRSRMPMKSAGVGHCPTGCVPVAVAQTLYFLYEKFGFNHPIYGISATWAHPSTDSTYVMLGSTNTVFPNQSLSSDYWSQLPKTQSDDVSPDYFNIVSTLMLNIGFYLPAKYYDNQTSSGVQLIPNLLSSRYSVSSLYCSPIDFDIVLSQIHERGVPCILGIRDSDDHGHAVIADGAKRVVSLYRKYYVRYDTNGNVNYMTTVEPQYSNYVCINWGWSGARDDSPVWYNVSSSWYEYNVFQKLVYDIYSDEE